MKVNAEQASKTTTQELTRRKYGEGRCGPQKQLRFENQHDTVNRRDVRLTLRIARIADVT